MELASAYGRYGYRRTTALLRIWRQAGLKVLTVVDEYSRECLSIVTRRGLKSFDALNVMADLFLEKELPQYIRGDNGPEFVAVELRKWLAGLGVFTLFIEPGSPWENGYIESLNGKFRD